ncbi:hypothetical protein [Terrisporobacter petrolearius]|uniref:hypothetical protein n=1 Tax=Terrisporobacter petrolearius TaxID=1460447 RepID=UPI003B00423C
MMINSEKKTNMHGDMLRKIGHGEIYLFESGGHPAMISNKNEFAQLSKRFFEK